jgi:hypothetical protein
MTWLPGWGDMTEADRAAAVLFLFVRSFERGHAAHHTVQACRYTEGQTFRGSPCRYVDDPVLTAMDPGQACNHATTLYPHYSALSGPERARLVNLAIPPQKGTRDARTAA